MLFFCEVCDNNVERVGASARSEVLCACCGTRMAPCDVELQPARFVEHFAHDAAEG